MSIFPGPTPQTIRFNHINRLELLLHRLRISEITLTHSFVTIKLMSSEYADTRKSGLSIEMAGQSRNAYIFTYKVEKWLHTNIVEITIRHNFA